MPLLLSILLLLFTIRQEHFRNNPLLLPYDKSSIVEVNASYNGHLDSIKIIKDSLPVFDQRHLPLCLSAAFIQTMTIMERKLDQHAMLLSATLPYDVARTSDNCDSSLTALALSQFLKNFGTVSEKIYPNDFTVCRPKLKNGLSQVTKHKVQDIIFVEKNVQEFRKFLQVDTPIIAVISVNKAFHEYYGIRTINVFCDSTFSDTLHAVIVLGYHSGLKAFLCKNSWGRDFGGSTFGSNFFCPPGYFYIEQNCLMCLTRQAYRIKIKIEKSNIAIPELLN